MAEHNRRPPTQGRLSSQEFARMVTQGQITPLDRLGQPIITGALVLFTPQVDTIFAVIGVTPMLDPRAPQGQARITLHAQFDIPVRLGMPLPPFIVVGMTQPEDTQRPVQPDNGNQEHKILTMPGSESSKPQAADTADSTAEASTPADEPPADPDE